MRILMDLSDLTGGMPEFCGIVLTSIVIEKKFKAGLIYWHEVGQSFNGVVVWSNGLQYENNHAARIRLCLGSLGLFIAPMLFFVVIPGFKLMVWPLKVIVCIVMCNS
ncbi:hypothetical protein Hdeb2414_s0024g00648711 [Helianthus debilis subsp. tardiflorus]